jgi:hypothetical protein
VDIGDDTRITAFDGMAAVEMAFTVTHARGSRATRLSVDAAVLVDGERPETDPPVGAARPHVIAWIPQGGHRVDEDELVIAVAGGHSHGRVFVAIPDDAMVSVALRATAIER